MHSTYVLYIRDFDPIFVNKKLKIYNGHIIRKQLQDLWEKGRTYDFAYFMRVAVPQSFGKRLRHSKMKLILTAKTMIDNFMFSPKETSDLVGIDLGIFWSPVLPFRQLSHRGPHETH